MNIEIPIKILSDEKGYLDRKCHNKNCLFEFKINMQDWEEKVSDDEVHCPMCGYVDSSDNWLTDEQEKAIRDKITDYANAYIFKEFDNMFSNLARSTKRNKNFKITYNRNKPITFVNNPIGAKEEWTLDITCDKCGTRYSVIGSAYFCPCCGYNSASNMFNNSIDMTAKMIYSIDEMKTMLTSQHDRDYAEKMCRTLIENSISQVVSDFQKFAQCRYKELSGIDKKVNDFQMVDKGSKYFYDQTGNGYEEFLSTDEIKRMKIYFQRRHIIEHNQGIVDQKYIDNSNDTDYNIDQRIVVKANDVLDFIAIIKKLSTGLMSLK